MYGRNAVHYTCEGQDPKTKATVPILKALIKHGAPLEQIGKCARNGFHQSAVADSLDTLEFLHEQGVVI